MKRTLGFLAVLMALTVSMLAQDADDNRRQHDRDDARREDSRGYRQRGRLSAEDQQRFDSYYTRWQEYRRTNNREQVRSMEERMREVMARNNIPSDVPFDEIASSGYREGGDRDRRERSRLSPEDQQRFDSYYSRWLEYRRTDNREQARSMEERMRDVMSRNNIPPDVPFDAVASRR